MYGDYQGYIYIGDYPPYGYGYLPTYYYPNYPIYRMGWQCPGCNTCYNPDVQVCWNCGKNTATWNINTSTADGVQQVNDKEEDGS